MHRPHVQLRSPILCSGRRSIHAIFAVITALAVLSTNSNNKGPTVSSGSLAVAAWSVSPHVGWQSRVFADDIFMYDKQVAQYADATADDRTNSSHSARSDAVPQQAGGLLGDAVQAGAMLHHFSMGLPASSSPRLVAAGGTIILVPLVAEVLLVKYTGMLGSAA